MTAAMTSSRHWFTLTRHQPRVNETSPGIDPTAQQQLAAVINRSEPSRRGFKVTKKGPKPLSPAETKQLANKAFRRTQWHRETFLDALDAISRAVRLLDDQTLASLIWRAQHTPQNDGYTTTPDGERVAGGGGDTKLTTVEAAAAQRIEAPPIPDPAGIAIRELMTALTICANQSAAIDRATQMLLHIHNTGSVQADDEPICAGCNKKILKTTRLHRIHGQPYHAEGSPNCYQAENHRQRQTRDNTPNGHVIDTSDNDMALSVISEPPCQ